MKKMLPVLISTLSSILLVSSVQTGWRPITRYEAISPAPTISFQSHIPVPHEECTLYKAIFEYDSYHQYIQYKTQIPDLKEFTLCTWHKFYNHSMDQPIFSYSQRDRPREILSWVANSDSASYYMFSVSGHTLYRLNYPVRLGKWYHSCQSWNGRTGEWQIWVNSERIGRGFHNLLVGKTIKGGGLAITGQEQRQQNNDYYDSYKSRGLFGEVTLVQLYKAALTAGKAYTNHKHHHVHHFHHEGKEGEDDLSFAPPGAGQLPPIGEENQATEFPFLRNGQLIPTLPVQQLSAFRAQEDAIRNQDSALNSPLNLLSSDGFLQSNPSIYSLQNVRIFKRDQSKETGRKIRQKKSDETANKDIEKVKRDLEDSEAIKNAEKSAEDISRIKRDIMKVKLKAESDTKELQIKKQQTESEDEKKQKKRTVGEQYPYGIIPGTDLSSLFQGDGYILGGGGERYNEEEDRAVRPHDAQSMAQMEPAEWEVRSIMALCSGCGEDPFRKANIISWRETPKKLYSGALYVPAVAECHRF